VTLRVALLLVAFGSGGVQAQTAETLGWLRKIQDATEKLSYTGTFIYHQNGGRSETSKITRYVDASGDI
jgi:negative regulator of sigma E activity